MASLSLSAGVFVSLRVATFKTSEEELSYLTSLPLVHLRYLFTEEVVLSRPPLATLTLTITLASPPLFINQDSAIIQISFLIDPIRRPGHPHLTSKLYH